MENSSSSGFTCMNSDFLHEILLRVDPSSIFNCILVSKDWHQVIAGSVFRRDYLTRWDGDPNLLLGFFMSVLWFKDCDNYGWKVELLPTSKLGHIISEKKPLQSLDDNFVLKSSYSALLLTADLRQHAFYVGNFASDDPPFQLPRPPAYYNPCTASIVESEEGFKVILIGPNQHSNVRIQTFCSWTRKWDQSTITCSTRFDTIVTGPLTNGCLRVAPGFVTKVGVVYWEVDVWGPDSMYYAIAAYDTNRLSITLVDFPEHGGGMAFGSSPQGSLRCATWRIPGMIKIWDLEDDDQKPWSLLYTLDPNSMWMENSAVLEPLFDENPRLSFGFLSFVPGRPDSIYVGLEDEIFLYHIDTNKLKRICYSKETKHSSIHDRDLMIECPVTMSGVWASSPSSLQIGSDSARQVS